MERDDPAAGGSWANPNRNQSPPGDRTKCGSAGQARRGVAPGTGSRGEEQRAPGDRLSRGIADAYPTPATDAVIAETNAGPSNRNYNFWRWRQWTKQSTYNWQRASQDFAA